MPVKRIKIANYRSFPPDGRDVPGDGKEFSPGVNIFVGPNGAGKSTLINALSIAFSRDAQTSQGAITYGRRAPHPCRDFNGVKAGVKPNNPWIITAEVEYKDRFLKWELKGLVTVRGFPDGTITWDVNGQPLKALPEDEEQRAALFNRGFPIGWPRKFLTLDQDAFLGHEFKGKKSPQFYEANRDAIVKDAQEYLDIDLHKIPLRPLEAMCKVCEEPLATSLPCKECGRGEGDKRPVFCIEDEHNQYLLEGSDGKCHFLYMIFEIRKHPWSATFLIEEPDVFMHPGLQRRFLQYVVERSADKERPHQFFISTHSPYMLDYAAQLGVGGRGGAISMYQLSYTNHTVISSVGLDDRWDLLRDLGHRPSDVLHPNGLIWVEGPSDQIYISTWLDFLALQRGWPKVRWGLDADFLWYGGSNIANLDSENGFWEQASEAQLHELMKVWQIHPAGGIVIDRDKYPNEPMRVHKDAALKGFAGRGSFNWLTQRATIEGYIPPVLREKCGIPDTDKVRKRFHKARKAREYVHETMGLVNGGGPLDQVLDTSTGIVKKLEEVYATIKQVWGPAK